MPLMEMDVAEPEDTEDEAPACGGCGDELGESGSCGSCLECARCGEDFPPVRTVWTVRGSTICRGCRDSYYSCCNWCGGWNRDGVDCGDDDCGSHGPCECGDCSDCEGDRSQYIHDYDYKPSPDFHGQGPLYLGLECEVEYADDDAAREAVDYLGSLGYLKEDSSVEGGFEIVTHPMSHAYAMNHFPWAMFPAIKRHGAGAGDSAGIHVHVSRAGFSSTCHTYRWLKFIYRNQAAVERIARRTSERWAAFRSDMRQGALNHAKGNRYADRYRAVNVTNYDTFEVRVFASSLDPMVIKGTLSFVAASVEYTRQLTSSKVIKSAGWSWEAFMGWVAERAEYAHLVELEESLLCAC